MISPRNPHHVMLSALAVFLALLKASCAEERITVFAQPTPGAERNILSRDVRIYLPTLSGSSGVESAISDMITFQLLRNLGARRRTEIDFSKGAKVQIVRDVLPLTENDDPVVSAIRIGADTDFVIWGQTYPVEEGLIIQLYLTLTPHSEPTKRVWATSTAHNRNAFDLAIDFPTRHFEFEPITISRNDIESFRKNNFRVIYTDRNLSAPQSEIVKNTSTLRWEFNAVQVQSDGKVGWVPLPERANSFADLTDLSAALTSFLQSDWGNVGPALDRMLGSERQAQLPRSFLIGILLLRGLAEERRGFSGRTYFSEAQRLNPDRKITTQYIAMANIAEFDRAKARRDVFTARRDLDDIRNYVADRRLLFWDTDPWYGTLAAAVPALEAPAVIGDLPQTPDLSFFVASRPIGKGGDLGGLVGADSHCQRLAAAVGAGNKTWRAYLSITQTRNTNAVNARDRIGNGPWQNAKGTIVAQDINDLHSHNNGINAENSLTETGSRVAGFGFTPSWHDALTGSNPEGRAFPPNLNMTCDNWTSSQSGKAMVGHLDRLGAGIEYQGSWNSSHQSRGCGQPDLAATGGNGLFYCFAQ